MTVLVATTYYGVPPELLRRSVESVLAQTYADLRLVVLGDGQAVPDLPVDPRVKSLTVPFNRGTYFGHAVMLEASDCDWYAPVDADDWVDPEHLARLLAAASGPGNPGAVFTGELWLHDYAGKVMRYGKHPYWVGLYATERLRKVGGFNPAERVGQDSLMMHLVRYAGTCAVARDATYHRIRRPGSLTTSRVTGLKSAARRELRARNRAVISQVGRLLPSWERIRSYRAGLVPTALWAEVSEQAQRL